VVAAKWLKKKAGFHAKALVKTQRIGNDNFNQKKTSIFYLRTKDGAPYQFFSCSQ